MVAELLVRLIARFFLPSGAAFILKISRFKEGWVMILAKTSRLPSGDQSGKPSPARAGFSAFEVLVSFLATCRWG